MTNAVADAPVLIYLARLGALDLLVRLYPKVLVPPSVHLEVVERGKTLGFPDALVIEQAIARGLLTQAKAPPDDRRLPGHLVGGERQVVLLSRQASCDALVDDREAYVVCKALGIRSRRTTSLLLEAVAKRIMTAKAFEDSLARLSLEGYFLSAEAYHALVSAARAL